MTRCYLQVVPKCNYKTGCESCAGRFHASATFTITIVFEHSAHSTLRNPPLSYRVHVGEFEWQFECT